MSLRTRLALVFIAATLVPLGPTVWLTTNLFERSLAPVDQLDSVTRALEKTGRQYYQQASERLKEDAWAGRITPQVYPASPVTDTKLADSIREFRDGNESERFAIAGDGGSQLRYLVRGAAGDPDAVRVWEKPLGIRMDDLQAEYRDARKTVSLDLRHGYFVTWGIVVAAIWLVALSLVWIVATRFSRPIANLTEALRGLAAGNFRIRVPNDRTDEIGLATQAFNHTATQLEQSRDRLVYLTQLASWQVLARKMAHEVKNSLTPIRLTVEEMVARENVTRENEASRAGRRAFLEQAAAIVVDEIESLERRIRAFSEFSSEPPVCPEPLDIAALVEERIAFLKTAHPEVGYMVSAASNAPSAMADGDLVKGILVNLLENAAEAAGNGGRILAKVIPLDDRVAIEVHDSGPGLSEMARKSLFQPTISFKKRGMGLGLSIARKSALLSGGDILLISGELGGAGFRVLLPGAASAIATNSGR